MNAHTGEFRAPWSLAAPGAVDGQVATSGADPPAEQIGYIRGAGGIQADRRRVARAVVVSCLVLLSTLLVALTVEAANQSARTHRLQDHGVPVEVTVTRCLGMASGTGITVAGYTCNGTFTIDGHRYNAVIGGTRRLYPRGETIQAITDPSVPSILSTTHAVATSHGPWRAFIAPAVVLLLLVVVVGLGFQRHREPDEVAPTALPGTGA